MTDKIVAWECDFDGEITGSEGLAENWINSGYGVKALTEKELEKVRECSTVNAIYKMAAPSLDPENFNNLEKALKELCETRHLNLVMCLDCSRFIAKDSAPEHACV